jgi:hypothetical protein
MENPILYCKDMISAYDDLRERAQVWTNIPIIAEKELKMAVVFDYDKDGRCFLGFESEKDRFAFTLKYI